MKKIRLYDEAYRSGHAFFITIATRMRRPGRKRLQSLFKPCENRPKATTQQSLHTASCPTMRIFWPPRHRTSCSGNSSITSSRFRAIALKRALNLSGPFWQTRYFDHALRQEESLETVASYIWENPVRAGLVAEARDRRYSGSLAFPDAFSSGAEAPDLLLLRRERRPT